MRRAIVYRSQLYHAAHCILRVIVYTSDFSRLAQGNKLEKLYYVHGRIRFINQRSRVCGLNLMNNETEGFTNMRLLVCSILNGIFLIALFFFSMEYFEHASECTGLACIGLVYYSLYFVTVAIFLTPRVFSRLVKEKIFKIYIETLVAFSAGLAACVVVLLFVGIIVSFVEYELPYLVGKQDYATEVA